MIIVELGYFIDIPDSIHFIRIYMHLLGWIIVCYFIYNFFYIKSSKVYVYRLTSIIYDIIYLTSIHLSSTIRMSPSKINTHLQEYSFVSVARTDLLNEWYPLYSETKHVIIEGIILPILVELIKWKLDDYLSRRTYKRISKYWINV